MGKGRSRNESLEAEPARSSDPSHRKVDAGRGYSMPMVPVSVVPCQGSVRESYIVTTDRAFHIPTIRKVVRKACQRLPFSIHQIRMSHSPALVARALISLRYSYQIGAQRANFVVTRLISIPPPGHPYIP